MGVIAPFVYADWAAAYPEFNANPPAYAGVTEAMIDARILPSANEMIGNNGASPVADIAQQTNFLWLAVAHLCQLSFGSQTVPASSLAGVVTSATQGTVSVSASYGPMTANSAFWLQTSYGRLLWQLMAPFRTFRYVPAFQRRFNPFLNQ
jgi:hypothetical protein